MFAFGLFSLISVACTYALGVITLVFIAVGGIYLWCGREFFRSQALREENERKHLNNFTGHEAAFLTASPNPSDDPMMIVCSWDEVAESNSLVRLVLMKRSDEDFVLVGIGFDAAAGSTKLVIEAVQLDVDTAVRLFTVSQRDKALKRENARASLDASPSGSGGSDGGISGGDGGSCGDGGGCGGDGGGGGGD
jgi:uncharacterized membrane protein YgcG